MKDNLESIKELIEQNRTKYFYFIINSNCANQDVENLLEICLNNEVEFNMAYLWIKKEDLGVLGSIYPIIREYKEPMQRKPIIVSLNIESNCFKLICSDLNIEDYKEESFSFSIPLKEQSTSVKTPDFIKKRRKLMRKMQL